MGRVECCYARRNPGTNAETHGAFCVTSEPKISAYYDNDARTPMQKVSRIMQLMSVRSDDGRVRQKGGSGGFIEAAPVGTA